MTGTDPAVQLLYSGSSFGGQGTRAVAPVVLDLIHSAEREVQILAYVITPSAKPLMEALELALKRGVTVTLVIDSLEQQHAETKLHFMTFQTNFPHFKLIDLAPEVLHAKVVIADRGKAVLGSANFSWSGLFRNHEIGVLLEGVVVWQLAGLVDRLVLDHAP